MICFSPTRRSSNITLQHEDLSSHLNMLRYFFMRRNCIKVALANQPRWPFYRTSSPGVLLQTVSRFQSLFTERLTLPSQVQKVPLCSALFVGITWSIFDTDSSGLIMPSISHPRETLAMSLHARVSLVQATAQTPRLTSQLRLDAWPGRRSDYPSSSAQRPCAMKEY